MDTDFVRRAWLHGFDTERIATFCGVPESDVYNLIARRGIRRILNR